MYCDQWLQNQLSTSWEKFFRDNSKTRGGRYTWNNQWTCSCCGCFLRDLKSLLFLNLLLNSKTEHCGISSLLGWVLAMCACPLSFELRLFIGGLPLISSTVPGVAILLAIGAKERIHVEWFRQICLFASTFSRLRKPWFLESDSFSHKSRAISHLNLKHDALLSLFSPNDRYSLVQWWGQGLLFQKLHSNESNSTLRRPSESYRYDPFLWNV